MSEDIFVPRNKYGIRVSDDGEFELPDQPAMDPQSGVLELISEIHGCLRLGTTSVSARVILERLGRIYESFEASP